jgi:hypothetical protein
MSWLITDRCKQWINIFVELRDDANTTFSNLFFLISTIHYISDLFFQFIISLTKINFSKENIIYNTRLHDPSMTRMLFSYPIIRAFNNNKFFSNQQSFWNSSDLSDLGGRKSWGPPITSVPMSAKHFWMMCLLF